MKQTNPKIAQKVINKKEVHGTEFSFEESEKQNSVARKQAIQNRVKSSREFSGIAEQIAQDKVCYINYRWPGSKMAFPYHLDLQTVDKYYPYAEGGPLFVDEPTRVDNLEIFEAKAKAMKDLGHRYLLIKPGMKFIDAQEALA